MKATIKVTPTRESYVNHARSKANYAITCKMLVRETIQMYPDVVKVILRDGLIHTM